MELMTISEAARRLGYKSRSQLYRLINDGYLHEHVHVQQHTGQRLVDIEGLREKLQCICQWRPDSMFLRQGAIGLGPHIKAECRPCTASVQVALIP